MRPSRIAGGSAFIALTLLFVPLAQADEPEMVHVRVFVAHAALSGNEIDPECMDLKRRLGPMKVGSLRKVSNRAFHLKFGQSGAMVLPTGGKLRVVPLSIIRERLHLRVQMSGVVSTRLQMTSGSPIIVGGPKHKGGNLIVQIVPEY